MSVGTQIYPDGDPILLPSTLQFLITTQVGDYNRVYACPDPRASSNPHRCDDYNPKLNTSYQVSGFVRGSAGANEDDNRLYGRFSVMQTVLTPIDVAEVIGQAKAPAWKRRPNRLDDPSSLFSGASEFD